MEPRRVLSVIPAPTFGGAANQVLRLSGPLAERGWHLVPVIPTEPGNVGDRLRSGGIEPLSTPLHRLRSTRNPAPHAALVRAMPGEVARLRAIIRRVDPTVVMNHGDLNLQPGIAGRLERRALHWQILDTRTPPALGRATSLLVGRWADSIATVGRALAAGYPAASAVGDRTVVIFPPVDADSFVEARARRAAARAELGVPEEAWCIGAIGNRNPQKGLDWLVRAAALARAKEPRLALRILGAASPGHEPYEREVRRIAETSSLGEANAFDIVDPGDRVPELIGAFDVLCMPAVPRSEGMPTVIFEAMAAGLPVVATDVGAVDEVVSDGETGYVVEPMRADLIADALLRTRGDRGVELGRAGRRRVETAFTTERLADLYSRAFEIAAEHHSAVRRIRRAS